MSKMGLLSVAPELLTSSKQLCPILGLSERGNRYCCDYKILMKKLSGTLLGKDFTIAT
jgi:hypothetical protein